MLEPREKEKLSPLAENCPEIWRVLASGDRRAIVEAVLGENASLGSVDPELARLVGQTVKHSTTPPPSHIYFYPLPKPPIM